MIPAQLQVGDVITTLTASDPDQGYNGQLKYKITEQDHYQMFGINTFVVSFLIVSLFVLDSLPLRVLIAIFTCAR